MKTLPSRPVLAVLASIFILILASAAPTAGQETIRPDRVTPPVEAAETQAPVELVTLGGHTHPLARPEYDRGAAPDSLPLRRMLLVLRRRADQEAALGRLLDDQQVKASPHYHHWLTPEQFGQQFGPTDAELQAVADWLTGQGFEIDRVAAGRTVIEFSGNAGLVREALHTEIHKFALDDEEYWANAGDPQIPAALAPVVAGFASLNNFPRPSWHRNLGTFRRMNATGEVTPLLTVTSSTGATYYAVGPGDFGTIYDVVPLWAAGIDGTGEAIAIAGQTNINPQDPANFRSLFGLPANPVNIILNGPDPGILSQTGDEAESDLDTEWSGAVARGATIDLVVSESTEVSPGIDLSSLYIVDNNLAPVMSVSYGPCESFLGAGGNAFYSTLWEQAAAQGISVMVAAGDSGSDVCDRGMGDIVAKSGLSVSGLASTPFNVAVGGTDFNDVNDWSQYWSTTNNSVTLASALSYIPETTWNDTCARTGSLTECYSPQSTGQDLAAGSGGASNCGIWDATGTTCAGGYPKPAWQTGNGVPADGVRDLPDVSLFSADGLNYSFYVFCDMDLGNQDGNSCVRSPSYITFDAGGGTSFATPAFAGIMALVNQKTGERQGNPNYVLYALAAQNGASCTSSAAAGNTNCIFHDVITGNNSVACEGGTPNCSNSTTNEYGVLVSPPNSSTLAWLAGPGYDLATGLGTVDATNLVNGWANVSFQPTQTTLSLSTTPPTKSVTVTHGQPVNVDVQVKPESGNGTPGGNVFLTAATSNGSSGNTTGVGSFALSNGVTSGATTKSLPGGTYNVTAHYEGNGIYGASDSDPVQVTVSQESSQTKLGLVTFDPNTGKVTNFDATTAVYGSSYLLLVDVTNSSTQPCASLTTGLIAYPCPTGTVTVTPPPTDQNPPPGTTPGVYSLSIQGYAVDPFVQLLGGTHNFAASYAGDNSYKASTASRKITITPGSTRTTLSASEQDGTNYQVLATILTTSSGVGPTGTVQFFNGGRAIGAPITVYGNSGSTSSSAQGGAGGNLTLPIGTVNLTAQYSGDSNYAGSASAVTMVKVTDFSLSVAPSTINISAAGQSGTATLTLTPLGGFTGTVQVNCGDWDLSDGISCSASPQSLNVPGTSPVTATLTITTVGAAALTNPSPQRRTPPSFRLPARWRWHWAGLLALVALSLAISRRRPAGWVLASTLLVVAAWVACGGGGGGGYTPPPPAPSVTLSPATLTFSYENMNTTSPPQSVTLTNVGNAPLSLSSMTLGGTNPGDFAQTNNCGSSVTAGANCGITVTFTPTATGSRSASVSISDNAYGSPQSVSLTGTGPSITFLPSSLNFGVQTVGTSAQQLVSLQNFSNTSVSISGVAIGGTNREDFAQANNCVGSTFAVPPEYSCRLWVTFTPTAAGPRSASVSVTDNAVGSPQSFSLTGTGAKPAISLSPSSLNFGAVPAASSSEPQTVTLLNIGKSAVSVTGIATSGENFALTNNCPTSIVPGAGCTIRVTFTPFDTGTQNGLLEVTDSIDAGALTVSLTGLGATPAGTYESNANAWGGNASHSAWYTIVVK
ncbi:MAG: choice-of-anchor D domain-containing protein [Terriglobia bacterium]